MKPLNQGLLALVGVFVAVLTTSSAFAGDTPPPVAAQSSPPLNAAADDVSRFDDRLGAALRELSLTPDQTKLWTAFVIATKRNKAVRLQARPVETTRDLSFIDRLQLSARRLQDDSVLMNQLAEGAKPLFDALDPDSKLKFERVLREVVIPFAGAGDGRQRGGLAVDEGRRFGQGHEHGEWRQGAPGRPEGFGADPSSHL